MVYKFKVKARNAFGSSLGYSNELPVSFQPPTSSSTSFTLSAKINEEATLKLPDATYVVLSTPKYRASVANSALTVLSTNPNDAGTKDVL